MRDVLDWLETHVPGGKLQGDRDTYLGCSPLRDDRTPSFSVSLSKRCYFDHGTSESGTISQLADMLGVECPAWDGDVREEKNSPARAKDAAKLWESGRPATSDHAYLAAKKVDPFDMRVAPDGRLMVPGYDAVTGSFKMIQTIASAPDESGKWAKRDVGRVKGALWVVGNDKGAEDSSLVIAEGPSTAAAVKMLCPEMAVVCSFGTANLPAVYEALRKRFPDREIVIASDSGTEDLVSKLKGVLPVIPSAARSNVDWNDVAVELGPEEAARQFQMKLESARGKAPKKQTVTNWDDFAGTLDGTGVRPIERFFGLFSKGQVSLVAGLSGSGKSLLMQSLAMAGADGTGLMGQSEPLKVLVIEGDACREVFADRCNAFGWKPHDNVRWIFCMEHPDVPFTTQSEDGRAALQKIIEDVRPDVVFIDSLSGVDAELDELDTQQMKTAFKALRDLASRNNVAIVILHHVRKAPAAFVDREPTLHDISGAGSATRFCYSIYAVWSEEIDGRRVNAVKSLKDWSEMSKSFSYAVGNDGDRKTVLFNLDETVVLAAKKQKPASRVLDAIASLAGDEFGADDIERASGASRASVSREVKKLVESKDLVKVAHGRSTKYRVSPYSRNLVILSGVYKNDENNGQAQSYQGNILLIKNPEGKNDEKDVEPVISSENVTRKVMRRIDRSSARGDVLFSSNTLHEEISADVIDEKPVEAPKTEQGFSSRGASAPGPLVEIESFPNPLPLPFMWPGHGWIVKVNRTGNGERSFMIAKSPNGKPVCSLREPKRVAA